MQFRKFLQKRKALLVLKTVLHMVTHIFPLFGCSKKKLCAIYGKWTECLYVVDPATFDANKKMDKKNSEEKKTNKEVTDGY